MSEKPQRRIDTYGLIEPFELAYEDRLVAFLDLLGFSRMVIDRKDEDVEFVVNLIPDMLRTHKNNVLREDLQVTNISDSIIMSVRAKPDKILKDLFNICVMIGRLQHELVINGYYMRGGISVGKLIHDSNKNLIVGPAYIQAYLLESKKSIVPRVVIGEEVGEFYGMDYDQMAAVLNNGFAEYYYQGKLIKRYAKGNVLWVGEPEIFVDYVSSIVGRERHGFVGLVNAFGTQLLAALQRGVEFEKYKWLAGYALDTIDSSNVNFDEKGRACMEQIRILLNEER